MMISDLPVELLEEILSRVPATSLKRLRSTCKLWNALFKDQRFTAKHFRKAAKESLALMLTNYKIMPMRVNLNVTSPSTEQLQGPLSLMKYSHLTPKKVDIYTVFHCDGLLLCTTTKKRLVVWNPCLGETRWIESKTGYDRDSRFALGYSKGKSGHNYKILMWSDIQHYEVNKFEIYEFSSDSWRVLDNVCINGSVILQIDGVCLKGNTYWISNDKEDKFLLSFDFTVERFKRLSLPEDHDQNMALSVVGENQLSMLSVSHYTSKMEIWISNKIDTNVEAMLKWSKCLTLKIPYFSDYLPVMASYLIDEEKKVVVSCKKCYTNTNMKVYIIGEDNEFYREIPYAESTHEPMLSLPIIFNYIPSLVQVNICKTK